MANVKISLSKDENINSDSIYSDIDKESMYIEKTLTDRKAIENSITNLLTWRQRERIMNPALGNSLWKRIFDNFSSFTPNDIRSEVRQILSYEPRIEIEDINVDTNIAEDELIISFTYSIPALDDAENGKQLSEYSFSVSR